jgi:death-on-curing protein
MSTLKAFGFVFEDHRNNSIDLVRYEVRTSWFGLSRRTERNRYMRMPYPGDGAVVSKDLVREIRERCALNEKNGCDSISFYSERRAPDFFIAKYRKTLHRLARV